MWESTKEQALDKFLDDELRELELLDDTGPSEYTIAASAHLIRNQEAEDKGNKRATEIMNHVYQWAVDRDISPFGTDLSLMLKFDVAVAQCYCFDFNINLENYRDRIAERFAME